VEPKVLYRWLDNTNSWQEIREVHSGTKFTSLRGPADDQKILRHVLDLQEVATDRLRRLEQAYRDLEGERAVLAMTVARLGGTVEGAPTHRINFLQRIDELRRIEKMAENERGS